MDPELDPSGDLDKNTASLEVGGTLKAGITKAELNESLEMDDCFNLKLRPKAGACVGPYCGKLDQDGNGTLKGKLGVDDKTLGFKDPFERKDLEAKWKVGLKICQQLKF